MTSSLANELKSKIAELGARNQLQPFLPLPEPSSGSSLGLARVSVEAARFSRLSEVEARQYTDTTKLDLSGLKLGDMSSWGSDPASGASVVLLELTHAASSQGTEESSQGGHSSTTGGVPSVPFSALTQRVHFLDLGNNNLSELPLDFHLMFPNLQILFLTKNKFSVVPPSLRELKKLTRLSLKENLLETMNSAVELPPNVVHLILTENALRSHPDLSFAKPGTFPFLRKLMLSGNRLTDVSSVLYWPTPWDEPGQETQTSSQPVSSYQPVLPALELVRLSRNDIVSIFPCEREGQQGMDPLRASNPLGFILQRLPQLAWISLAGNPITGASSGVPPAIAMSEAASLLPNLTARLEAINSDTESRLGEGASGVVFRSPLTPPPGPSYGSPTSSLPPVTSPVSPPSPPSTPMQAAVSPGSSVRSTDVAIKCFKAISSDGSAADELRAIAYLSKPQAEQTPNRNQNQEQNQAGHNPGLGKLQQPTRSQVSAFGNNSDEEPRSNEGSNTVPESLLAALGVVELDSLLKELPESTRKRLRHVAYAAVFPLIRGALLGLPPTIREVSRDSFFPTACTDTHPCYHELPPHEASDPQQPRRYLVQFPDNVTELNPVDGSRLQQCLSTAAVALLALDVARAMAAMHAAQVVHGDLYCHNIFLAEPPSSTDRAVQEERRPFPPKAIYRNGTVTRAVVSDFGASFPLLRTEGSRETPTGGKESVAVDLRLAAKELEAVEVRAFGYFLEDLLVWVCCRRSSGDLLQPQSEGNRLLRRQLLDLQELCFHSVLLCRPTFKQIVHTLEGALENSIPQ